MQHEKGLINLSRKMIKNIGCSMLNKAKERIIQKRYTCICICLYTHISTSKFVCYKYITYKA